MTTWQVTNRTTGEVVHAYTSDEPVNWPGMSFDAFNHIAVVAAAPVVQRRLTKRQYMNLFTDTELAAIYSAAKAVVQIEVWLAKFNAATPDPDGTSIDLDNPETLAGLQALEGAGLIGPGRAAEILG